MTSQMSQIMTMIAGTNARTMNQSKPTRIPWMMLTAVNRYSGIFLKYFLYIVSGWVIIGLEIGERAANPLPTLLALKHWVNSWDDSSNQRYDFENFFQSFESMLLGFFLFLAYPFHLPLLILLYYTGCGMSIDFEEKWLTYAENLILSAGFR